MNITIICNKEKNKLSIIMDEWHREKKSIIVLWVNMYIYIYNYIVYSGTDD